MTEKQLKHWRDDFPRVTVYDQQFNFDFDSYYVMEPNETQSGAWEVWYAEYHGEDMKQAELTKKLIEVRGDSIKKLEDLQNFMAGLILGFGDGYEDGKRSSQQAAKFAFKALMGDADIDVLIEAAEQDGFP